MHSRFRWQARDPEKLEVKTTDSCAYQGLWRTYTASGQDVTIGTVHMWFKRTQTALESAGIPSAEILSDLKERFEDV